MHPSRRQFVPDRKVLPSRMNSLLQRLLLLRSLLAVKSTQARLRLKQSRVRLKKSPRVHFVIERTLEVRESVLVRLASLLYTAETAASAAARVADAAAKHALEQAEQVAALRKEIQAIAELRTSNVD